MRIWTLLVLGFGLGLEWLDFDGYVRVAVDGVGRIVTTCMITSMAKWK